MITPDTKPQFTAHIDINDVTCPISLERMNNPVVLVGSGMRCDEANVALINSCPVTRKPILGYSHDFVLKDIIAANKARLDEGISSNRKSLIEIKLDIDTLRCPISHKIFCIPVVLHWSGKRVEQSVAEALKRDKKPYPGTSHIVTGYDEDYLMKGFVHEYLEQYPEQIGECNLPDLTQVNSQGMTLLMIQLQAKINPEFILKSMKAKPQDHAAQLLQTNHEGCNALMIAIQMNSPASLDIIKCIHALNDEAVKAQIILQMSNKGFNAFMLAVRHQPELVPDFLPVVEKIIPPSWLATAESDDSLIKLRHELIRFAYNKEPISSNGSTTDLLALLNQYPYVLTLPLDEDGNTFLHLAFYYHHVEVIDELIKHPLWDLLVKVRSKHQNPLSLFDIIANNGQLRYYALLKSLSTSSDDLRYALRAAAQGGYGEFCMQLLLDGADPSFIGFEERKSAESSWSGSPEANPMTQFLRKEFIRFAGNDVSLPPTKKMELFDLVKKHTHYLTWGLDSIGNTLVHYAFYHHHADLIDYLFQLPQWERFVKLRNKNGELAIEFIVCSGNLTHYECMKKCLTNVIDISNILRNAALYGHADFCRRLLLDGANPLMKDQTGKTTEECWLASLASPATLFNPFTRSHHLEEKKHQILTLLKPKPNAFMALVSSFFASENKALTNLCNIIQRTQFKEKDDPEKTPNALLNDLFDQWGDEFSKHVSHDTMERIRLLIHPVPEVQIDIDQVDGIRKTALR